MSTINPNESLDNKLEVNKQKEFAEERNILTKDELGKLDSPFGNYDPEKQKQKEAEIAAKIAAEEAEENNDILDFDYGTTTFDENSIVPQEAIDAKIEESNSDIKQSNSEFIGKEVGSHVVEKVATEAILGTATGGLSTVIGAVSTVSTINEVSEHIEEKDDIEMKKNKESFKEYFAEDAKLLYKEGIVSENKKDKGNLAYRHNDLLEHLASNYTVNENEKGIINKNKDLNLAFNETLSELLKGKHNENPEQIDNFMNKLKATNDLGEKFKIFLEIENLIDTSEGSHGARQAKAFEQVMKVNIAKIKTTQDFANKLVEYIQRNTQEAEVANERLKEITDQLFDEDKTISQNEVIDIISEVSDIIGANIKES